MVKCRLVFMFGFWVKRREKLVLHELIRPIFSENFFGIVGQNDDFIFFPPSACAVQWSNRSQLRFQWGVALVIL